MGCVKTPIYSVCVLAVPDQVRDDCTSHFILIAVNQFSIRLRGKPAMTR